MPTCRAERRWFSRQQLIARPTRELAALLGASRPEPDAMIRSGWPATEALILLADSYVACQEQIARTYLDRAEWTKRSILNVASMGKFSSDRTIRQYAEEVWDVRRVTVK